MTHRPPIDYAKNYCNRALIVIVIVENVVTCFLLGHSVLLFNLGNPITVVSYILPGNGNEYWITFLITLHLV